MNDTEIAIIVGGGILLFVAAVYALMYAIFGKNESPLGHEDNDGFHKD